MNINTLNELKKHPKYYEYLHENSEYYELLIRDPNYIKQFIKDMKVKYHERVPDKINKVVDKIDTINNIMDVIK